VTWFGRAALVGAVGTTPGPAFGVEAGLGFRVRALSLEVTGRAETTLGPQAVDLGARVETTIFTGGLALCGMVDAFYGCAAARLGVLQGRAPDVADPSLGASFYSAAVLHGGYELRLPRAFALRLGLEGGAALVRTSLIVDGQTVWTAPPVLGGLEIALLVSP
jgi:hypothetical protein